VSIPQAHLALRLNLLEYDKEILVVCRSGARSLRAARFLKAVGYPRVRNMEGGMLKWLQAGHPTWSQSEPEGTLTAAA
jgi:rhodanese-related sulfurtransferase